MQYIILLFIAIATVSTAPTSNDAQAKIINYENDNDGKGNYEFSYETSNGLFRYETGYLVNAGQPDEHIVVEGKYSYIDTKGVEQTVRYSADETGYHVLPESATLKPDIPPDRFHLFQESPVPLDVLATLLGG